MYNYNIDLHIPDVQLHEGKIAELPTCWDPSMLTEMYQKRFRPPIALKHLYIHKKEQELIE